MSSTWCLSASDFAALADAAIRLGLHELGKRFLTAAYDRMNGEVVSDQANAIKELRFEYLDAGLRVDLTERQSRLLRLFTKP